MNGAESLVHTLIAGGIDTCFVNPGTSEMHFVAALDRVPGLRCILGLQENVVTGAADGFWRMAERPAATLLHCGPGLANGLANLHNARRARAGIVNIVGDQATHHRPLDAALTADTEGLARSVSAFVRTTMHAADVGADAAVAIQAARTWPGAVVTLILPADASWNEGGRVGAALPPPAPAAVAPTTLETIARVLRSGEPALLLIGGRNLRQAPLAAAARIAERTGTALMAPMHNARVERGAGRFGIARLPYAIDQALAALAGYEHLILVGAPEPVGFFAYPGKPGRLFPADGQVHVLARPDEDGPAALAALADLLHAAPAAVATPADRPAPACGAANAAALAQTLAALLPDQAIVVDEGSTLGRGAYAAAAGAAPHDWLQLTGGAIGMGLPVALGAAVAAPGRRVVALQADGSAMYTLQALWTQAREKLDVTTILLSNRKYAILLGELAGVGAEAGPTAHRMMDLGSPDLDWVRLAEGMGVAAARADDCETLAALLRTSFATPGPFLIELVTA